MCLELNVSFDTNHSLEVVGLQVVPQIFMASCGSLDVGDETVAPGEADAPRLEVGQQLLLRCNVSMWTPARILLASSCRKCRKRCEVLTEPGCRKPLLLYD